VSLECLHAARDLRDEGKLYTHEEERLDSIVQWFAEHLEKTDALYCFQAPVLSQEE